MSRSEKVIFWMDLFVIALLSLVLGLVGVRPLWALPFLSGVALFAVSWGVLRIKDELR